MNKPIEPCKTDTCPKRNDCECHRYYKSLNGEIGRHKMPMFGDHQVNQENCPMFREIESYDNDIINRKSKREKTQREKSEFVFTPQNL